MHKRRTFDYVKETKQLYDESFFAQPTDTKLKELISWIYKYQNMNVPNIYIFDSPSISQYGFSILSNIENSGVISDNTEKHRGIGKRHYDSDFILISLYNKLDEIYISDAKNITPPSVITNQLFRNFNIIRNELFFSIGENNVELDNQNNIFLEKAIISLNEQLANPICFKIKNHQATKNGKYSRELSLMFLTVMLSNQTDLSKENLAFVLKLKEILSMGLNIVYASLDAIIICRNPLKLLLDDKHRLNSTFQSAVEWRGEIQHFVHGVYFDEELFNKIFIDKKITPGEIMILHNLEQKAVVIQEFGFDYIISLLKDKNYLDKYTEKWNDSDKHINYELFECKLETFTTIRLLKVEWWENRRKRETVLGIPRNEGIDTCKEAVAWTFGMTSEEYNLEKQF